MLHYYTTGAYRNRNNHSKPTKTSSSSTATTTTGISAKKKSSSLLVDCQRMEKQLPKVQELFAEAFVELQKDIGEESARAFQSVATAEDPLALLLGSTASHDALSRPVQNSIYHKKPSQQKTTTKDQLEGGFIREAALPERFRKLQNPSARDGFASANNNKVSTNTSRKRPFSTFDATTTQPTNPYQRKPPTNIWNQIVDAKDGIQRVKKGKMKWEDVEKEMTRDITSTGDKTYNASSKKCSCGSSDVEISGNITSRNNDMMKGEVWGTKSRAEVVVERFHCLVCGKTSWNDNDG